MNYYPVDRKHRD